jgi:acetyl-CoA synthetase
MSDIDETEQVSESQIAVHWREEEYFPPPPAFVQQANANDPAIFARFTEDKFPDCFTEYADLLSWDKRWDTVLDTSNAPFWKWFVGGKLNASYNCVDRHAAANPDKTAIIWVPELEEDPTIYMSYGELLRRVNEFAALLSDFAGLKKGDRVTLHMPMVPEAVVTMLACARLGVIHSQVFGGFSGNACGTRIADSGSRVLITMDGYYRAGSTQDHKVKADEAVAEAKRQNQDVDQVLVWRRKEGEYQSKTPMVDGRDFFINDVIAKYEGQDVAPVSLDSTDSLFLMYTSGTTGRPKGAQHSVGGYMAYVTGTSKYYQDIHPDDVYWCLADIGWITGHSYIVYGPLALGTTTVLYEGVPNYPDAGRPWRIAEKLGVNIFHTSPTSIRMLRKVGADEPVKYNYHFKHMTTVGEPIEPEVWRWYYHSVGKDQAAVVDTWWQTETGGFLGSTLPGLHPQPVARHHADGVGPAGAVPRRLLPQVQHRPEQQGLARLAVLLRGRRDAGRGRLLPYPRPHRRRHQCGGPPARHEGTGVGRADRARGGGGRRGAGHRRHPRPDGGDVHLPEARLRRRPGNGGEGRRRDRDRDRQDRAAEERLDRAGHAQDAVRQDHAPGHRVGVKLRRCR